MFLKVQNGYFLQHCGLKIMLLFYYYHVVWTGALNLGLALKAVDSILKHEYQQSTQAFTTYSQRSLEFDCRRQQLEKKRCSKVYISYEMWELLGKTFHISLY